MNTNFRNLTEIVGETPADELPSIEDGDNWKQFSIAETLTVPKQKPDIEQLVKVMVQTEISSTKVINTPTTETDDPTTNLEDDTSTGKKLVVEGVLHQKIIYVADEDDQSVHAAEFKLPFSTFIVLPEDVELADKFKVDAFIEDIFVDVLDKRNVFKNVTLFLLAEQI